MPPTDKETVLSYNKVTFCTGPNNVLSPLLNVSIVPKAIKVTIWLGVCEKGITVPYVLCLIVREQLLLDTDLCAEY